MDASSSNLIASIIGLITIVLAIFGASWLNSRNTERLIESLRSEFRSEINRLDQRISSLEKRLDERFAMIDQRFAMLEQRLERIELAVRSNL
jgi:predicted PurR-regulated permease PerM